MENKTLIHKIKKALGKHYNPNHPVLTSIYRLVEKNERLMNKLDKLNVDK